MDVDAVKLPKKLTPEEREQCVKKGLCFRCRKSGHMASACPVLRFTPILFFSRTYFSFPAITHPSHVIGPLTPLVFVIAPFHPLPRTSMTHFCLLVRTSSRFHRIPPCSFCFVIVLELSESQVYKPSTRYLYP